MEYHLISVHTCAIRFHSSVRLRQHGSDFLDSYSAYHYEVNCITLYRWGRYSTGSRCEACNSEAQECRRNQWPGLVLWTGCFEGCWLLLVVLCPLARVLVG